MNFLFHYIHKWRGTKKLKFTNSSSIVGKILKKKPWEKRYKQLTGVRSITEEIKMYLDFVIYQIHALYAFYNNNINHVSDLKDKFHSQGFMVAGPWHGNPLEAEIIFLSSNPAHNYSCYYPRVHCEKWFSPSNKHQDIFYTFGPYDNSRISKFNTKKLQNTNTNIKRKFYFLTKGINYFSFGCAKKYIYDFLLNRLLDSRTGNNKIWPILINDKGSLYYKNPGTNFYWTVVKDKIIEEIYKNRNLGVSLRKVLLMEVVPLLSGKEFGVTDNACQHYWGISTRDILKLCKKSKILLIVGTKAYETFWCIQGETIKAHIKSNKKFVCYSSDGSGGYKEHIICFNHIDGPCVESCKELLKEILRPGYLFKVNDLGLKELYGDEKDDGNKWIGYIDHPNSREEKNYAKICANIKALQII